MGSDRLYEMLAEAKSRPSGAYRALEAALNAGERTIGGYERGLDIEDKLRKRKTSQQTLQEILGGRTIPGTESIQDVTMENLPAVSGLNKWQPETGMSDLDKEMFRDKRHQASLDAADKRSERSLAMMMKQFGLKENKENEERQLAETKRKKATSDTIADSMAVLEAINDAIPRVGVTTAGFLGGGIASKFSGTDAFDLNETLDQVRSSVGFDKLQKMRENSPTGGALGAVSDRENKLLQSTRGSLEIRQSPPQLEKTLIKMGKHFENSILAMEGQTRDEEANNAIAAIIDSQLPFAEKRARVMGIKATAERQ